MDIIINFFNEKGGTFTIIFAACTAIALVILLYVIQKIREKKKSNKPTTEELDSFSDKKVLSRIHNFGQLSIGTAISIGKRNNQQDSLFPPKDLDDEIIASNGYLSILCDGMGGMECGEVASQIACQEIASAFYKSEYDGAFDEFIEQTVYYVDTLVKQLKNSKGEPARAGTTMICTLIKEDVLSWASVGDSRIYKISGDEIVQLTRDHNYALQLKMNGKDEVEANADPKAQALISYIGMGGVSVVDICNNLKLCDGDIIAMCSDGIYGSISDDLIKKYALAYKHNMEKAAKKILRAVLEKNKQYQDNASLIMLSYNK